MPHGVADSAEAWGAALQRERARLVHLCLHLTHDQEAAEDLAQETLLKAWVNLHQLRDQERFAQWLSAIARSECWHWVQSQQRPSLRSLPHGRDSLPLPPNWAEEMSDEVDLAADLERKERAAFLDRALALLPSTTRTILVERYVCQSPQATIAARLGMSEGAIKVRAHRGKRALRRILATTFGPETASWHLSTPDTLEWQETRIWCPICGRQRLVGRFATGKTALTLRCPTCHSRPGGVFAHTESEELFRDISGFKPALTRMLTTTGAAFRHGRCLCGGPQTLLRVGLEDAPLRLHCAESTCLRCHRVSRTSLPWLVLASPEGQRFWRENPRIHVLPEHEVEAAGGAALVTSLQSLTGQARLDVVSTRQTFAMISVTGAPRT